MCEKDFMTAESLKCVTALQELIPGTRALYRRTLGLWLHSGADAEGEHSPATVHVTFLFAMEWQVRRKHPAYLVTQGMDRDVFCWGTAVLPAFPYPAVTYGNVRVLAGVSTFFPCPFTEVYTTKSWEWPEGTHLG